MAKLYPPYIDGSLPAAYLDSEGWHLSITYAMNRAVALAQTSGISLLIKTISGDIVNNDAITISNSSIKNYSFTYIFDGPATLNVGQYYKVQLAYVATNGDIGYYSTVGIMKAIAKPYVSIGLEEHSLNYFQGSFTGYYKIPEKIGDIEVNDLSERVYSYCFNIYDSNGKLYTTSGELIHDNNTDSLSDQGLRLSYDIWNPDKFGEETSMFYTIEYKITTLNGYVGKSNRYRLQMHSGLTMDPPMIIYPLPDFDNGCVEVVLIGEPDEQLLSERKYTGSYSICRKVVSKYEDESWIELHRFRLTNQAPSTYVFRDFTVEQGVIYKYSIQQINSYGIFTTRIVSAPVYADFEDMFLFDGQRALRIRFNPQVSSFKTVLQESKTDTIGSKYPYFFRNGNVAYKEFPIAGLLSYFVDDAELFIEDAALGLEPERGNRKQGSWIWGGNAQDGQYAHEDDHQQEGVDYSQPNITYRGQNSIGSPSYISRQDDWVSRRKQDAEARVRTRNFTGYNMFAERKFKLQVLDWLNNGELKLFKSPAEGNYVVRLMNSSLSPQDALGRMLHNFSCTAYEAVDNTPASLKAANIIWFDNIAPEPEYQWETIWLHEAYNQIENKDNKYYTDIKVWDEEDGFKYISIKKPEGIISFEVRDLLHYDYFSFHYKDAPANEFEDIVIGPTGNYIMHHEIKPIDEIRLVFHDQVDIRPGHIDICFLTEKTCNFDTIIGIKQDAILGGQIMGDNSNVLRKEDYWYINNWDHLKLILRPLIPIFRENNDKFWLPPQFSKAPSTEVRKYENVNQVLDDCGSTYGIYQIVDAANGIATNEYYAWNGSELVKQPKNFVYDTRFAINGSAGKLDDRLQYVEYHHLTNIQSLWLGTGVLAEATYQTFKLEYKEEQ